MMWVRAIAVASLVALACGCHEPQDPVTTALAVDVKLGAADGVDIRHLVPNTGQAVEQALLSYGYESLHLTGPRPPGFENFPKSLSESFSGVPRADGAIRRVAFHRSVRRGDVYDQYGVFVDLGKDDAVLQARGSWLFSVIS